MTELNLKSAYGDCVKNCVYKDMKNNFKNSDVSDKWIYANMIMNNQNPTFEPFLTVYGSTIGTYNGRLTTLGGRMCTDYIFFSRLNSSSGLDDLKSKINCSGVLQMPPMDIQLENTNMPNRFNPSNHYSICADFIFHKADQIIKIGNQMQANFVTKANEKQNQNVPEEKQNGNKEPDEYLGKRSWA